MGMPCCLTEMLERLDPSVVSALAVVGGLVLARSVLCLLGTVFKTFLRPGKNLKKEYGAWAVVTGATGEQEREGGGGHDACMSFVLLLAGLPCPACKRKEHSRRTIY